MAEGNGARGAPHISRAPAPHERRADAAGHEHIRKVRPEYPDNFAGGLATGGALVGRLAGVLRTRLPYKSASASGGARQPVQKLD